MASTPKSPDPYAVAQAQGNENMKWGMAQSIMGNVNETNPFGSVNYSTMGQEPIYDAQGKVSGYAPRWQRNVSLSPDQQKLLQLQTGAQTNLGQLAVQQSGMLKNLLAKPVDAQGLPSWQAYNKAPAVRRDQAPTDRDAIEQAMMGRYNRDASTQAQQQDATLAARGLSPGSAQYGQVQEGRDRSRVDAQQQAYLASGQESRAAQGAYNQAVGQEFEQNNAYTSAENARRGQMLQERENLQSFPVNLVTALMSGSQVTTPSFQPYNAPNIQSVPVGQYIYDDYNNKSQQAAQTNQGIFGLAGGITKMLPWGSWLG